MLYGPKSNSLDGFCIGNRCREEVLRLSPTPDKRSFDFLTIALSVIAVDQFILRSQYGNDGFSRDISLTISLSNPDPWTNVSFLLENALNFLTGDSWKLTFQDGGVPSPAKYEQKGLRKFTFLHKSDAACLFSGGLDSFLAIAGGSARSAPVLISRASTGDLTYQDSMAAFFPEYKRFVANDSPQWPENLQHEISTRSRSILFLALGTVVCSSIHRWKNERVPLVVPENGFIALNPPLTKRRIGANSTRTAHPYYLSVIQEIFDKVEVPVVIENPFSYRTKGEILNELSGNTIVSQHAADTVSCGHWKRRNKQCGRCWPCLIRRASFHRAKLLDHTPYQTEELINIVNSDSLNKDLKDVLFAIYQYDKKGLKSAPFKSIRHLPTDKQSRENYHALLLRGFEELREFLFEQGVWA